MTQERHISVWNNCLNFIQHNIDPKQFAVWFRPIRPASLVDSTLTLEVPSEFFREYLEGAYLDILKAALKKELGVGAKLDQLHSVKQRTGDAVERVCGCQKQAVRKVEGKLHEMIAEALVLLGIQYLEQSRGGVSVRVVR